MYLHYIKREVMQFIICPIDGSTSCNDVMTETSKTLQKQTTLGIHTWSVRSREHTYIQTLTNIAWSWAGEADNFMKHHTR